MKACHISHAYLRMCHQNYENNVFRIFHTYLSYLVSSYLCFSIPKMSGIIADSDTDRGVAQLRNTILHTFVNSGNAQV